MIACEGVRELAQAYLEGELKAQECERLERHLHACPSCRQVLSSYRTLFAALAEPALPAMRADFAAGVLARAATAERRRRAWQALTLAAALFVAVGAAVLVRWGGLPDEAAVADVAPSLDGWRAAWDSVVEFVEGAAATAGDWLRVVPGGALALALLAAGLAAQLILAYRWRTLASPDVNRQARVVQ
ncbi:MAG TPA: zf-HC2 domain-containing protein [Planctomycetota bacterium]|nr:zf-HC2 domain-containing protein [Planctomycetota bacterium]